MLHYQEQNIFSDKYTLRFREKKYNIEYNKISYLNLKKFNFRLSICLTLFSILLAVILLIVFNSSQMLFSNLNIIYEDVNNTNITEKDLNKIMLFYNRFVLYKKISFSDTNSKIALNDNSQNKEINKINNNESIQQNSNIKNGENFQNITNYSLYNTTLNNNTLFLNYGYYITYNDSFDYDYLKDCLRKIIFSKNCLYIWIFYCFVNIITFAFTIVFKKFYILKLNFSIIYIFLGINFHILSGIFRSFFNLGTETLFLVIFIQLLIQIFISLHVKINWRIFFYTAILRSLYEICLWNIFHFTINQILIFYFIVGVMGSLVSIIISYNKEVSSKTEFFWNSKTIYKDYLTNLLYNINQGFLSFKKNQVIFINKSMEKILQNNNINLKCLFDKGKEEDEKEDGENFMEIEEEQDKNIENKEKDNILKQNETCFRSNVINNESDNQILDSNLNDEYKKEKILNNLLDNLLENFSEVNEKLPYKLQKELKYFICKNSITSILKEDEIIEDINAKENEEIQQINQIKQNLCLNQNNKKINNNCFRKSIINFNNFDRKKTFERINTKFSLKSLNIEENKKLEKSNSNTNNEKKLVNNNMKSINPLTNSSVLKFIDRLYKFISQISL